MTPRKGSVIFVLIAGAIGVLMMHRSTPTVPPSLLEEPWWGLKDTKPDQTIRPFRITFPEDVVQDLKRRLANTRELTPNFVNTGQTYGVRREVVTSLTNYWLNEYDFAAREKYLNKFPQFVTNIQGLDIHFLHVKPKETKGKKVLPLLILHGWPGSVAEFYKIIPKLTTPRAENDFVFEVIAPSLPGFGFSEGTTKPGLGYVQMATIIKNLMLRLGHNKFYNQGGDWGSFVATAMAAMYPEHVLGVHSNMCNVYIPSAYFKLILYSIYPSLVVSPENYHLAYPVHHHILKFLKMSGYLHLQATKPDTIGVAMADSPAALTAYVIEKFSDSVNIHAESGKEFDFIKKFTMDSLIDNLMMYWVPNSMTTAMRLYAESINVENLFEHKVESVPINVPSACSQFPNEIVYCPEKILKERYKNLVHVNKLDRGGHFAAFEEPELFASEVWTVVGKMENLNQ